MQFRNLSVAQKIWALVLVLMVSMLAAGTGMTGYIKSLEQQLREQLQDVEDRIRAVVELRGSVELEETELIARNLSVDPDATKFFDSQLAQTQARVNEQLNLVGSRLTTKEGQELLRQVIAQRQTVEKIARQLSIVRQNDGDVAGTVQTEMLPAVKKFVQLLDQLVQRQDNMREQITQAAGVARNQAYMIGWGAVTVVVLLGLLVAVWLVRQLIQPLERAVSLAESIAEGDLTRDVHDDRKDELGQLLRSLNTMTQRLRALVGEVSNGVDSVSSAASQIATGNQDLSARTEQTAANLEETAASVEELTATVTQSADTARQANQLATTAVQVAERGGEVVSQVVMSMDQINTSSRKISDIIGVIDGIAFQTNILALNAAVEAARAGEQGRGFAVVAGEVRSLAQRSAEAAKEIKALIATSVSNVDRGAQQVAQAGESMQDIVASVRRVTDLIGEISASSHEQRDGIAQVNQAVSNLDQMTQQNAALVEESSAAAVAMNEQAQRLAQVVAQFNVGQQPSQQPLNRPVVRLRASAMVAPTVTVARKPKDNAGMMPPPMGGKPDATRQAARASVAPAATKAAQDAAASSQLLRPAPLSATASSSGRNTVTNDDDWETF